MFSRCGKDGASQVAEKPTKLSFEFTWACGPPMEMKVAVILSEAKDLQFQSEANQCRFFASLRMTDFRESAAGNLALPRGELTNKDPTEIPRCPRNDRGKPSFRRCSHLQPSPLIFPVVPLH